MLEVLIARSFIERSQLVDEVSVIEFETGVDKELATEE